MIKLNSKWEALKLAITKKFSRRQQDELLSDFDILESNEPLYNIYAMIILIILIVISLIIWAIFTDVEEIARTQGEIIPLRKIVNIQHQFGGSVKKVFVENGEQVKKGQSLVLLDSVDAQAELEKNIYHLINLRANQVRLKANLDNENLSTEQLIKTLKNRIKVPPEYHDTVVRMLQDSSLLGSLEQATDLSEISVLQDQVKQNEIELDSLLNKAVMQKEMSELMKEELAMYEKLKIKHLASQREILAVKRQYVKLRSEELATKEQIEKQRNILSEYQSKLNQAKSGNKLDIVNKMNTINSEIIQTERNIFKIQDQFDKLDIKSPISGIVKGINVTEGSVVSSNETLMDIVPSDSHLIVETKIASRDIGYVKTGDPVKIKVSSYEYIKYGVVNGTLKHISATTFLDDKTREVYYKGYINLAKYYVGHNPRKNKLMPGMLVEADIYTGKKSVMEYLLKPIYRVTDTSFSER